MIELLSLIFGGVARLGQHWLDLKEKQAERNHELAMFDKQVDLADKRFAHDADLRRMDAAAAESAADSNALIAAIQAQAAEAQAAGGWVAMLSAAIRPFLTLWHCVVVYTTVKIALMVAAWQGGANVFQALLQVYGEPDRALCFSMLSFWFVDRALRKKYGA
jgi:hypothetical protein